tara:strand:+ start:1427 stop:1882 length:456 start_codon:yes stop_codon:yes gene_type:complete
MKVYTEVNYEWKDGELVKTSSESFEYSGDIALCGGGGGGGGGNILTKAASRIHSGLDDTVDIVRDPAGTIKGGPGGTIGQITDKLYGGSFQDLVEGAQGKTEEEAVAPPVLSAEEVDPQAALTAQNQKRKAEAGRGAANMTAGQTATLLTS